MRDVIRLTGTDEVYLSLHAVWQEENLVLDGVEFGTYSIGDYSSDTHLVWRCPTCRKHEIRRVYNLDALGAALEQYANGWGHWCPSPSGNDDVGEDDDESDPYVVKSNPGPRDDDNLSDLAVVASWLRRLSAAEVRIARIELLASQRLTEIRELEDALNDAWRGAGMRLTEQAVALVSQD